MTAAIRAVLVDRHQNRKFLLLVARLWAVSTQIAPHLRAGFACFFFLPAGIRSRPNTASLDVFDASGRKSLGAAALTLCLARRAQTAQPRAVHLYQRHHSVFDDEHASKRCASLSS